MEKTNSQTNGQILNLQLLGACTLTVDGRAIEMRRKPKMLVKLLALQPHFSLHREQIVEVLWRDQDTDAAINNLHKTVHAARRAFEPEIKSGNDSKFILTKDGQIILSAPGDLRVDVLEFERLAELALKSNDKTASEAAIALYTGDLLPEDLYEDWAARRRETLRLSYQRLLHRLGEIYESGERFEQSVGVYQKLLAFDQTDESAHRSLMQIYALSDNRAQALKQFEICRRVLKEELSVEPGRETIELYGQIQSGKIQAKTNQIYASIKPQPKTNLINRLTSFVGREREIAEIKNLLASSRLLTLTGTGGIGKTRLAQKIAAESIEKFADGVWFVELAALNDFALVPSAIADIFDINEKAGESINETLSEFLREREMLLVLDNCEHLVAPSAEIAIRLLANCPRLKILATSREALDAEGEIVWRVSALSLPEEKFQFSDGATLDDYEAVKLFVERARLNDPRFAVNQANQAAIVKICRRLDGIPLALELAAARVRVISPAQIAERLDSSLKILTGGNRGIAPRHQTLRAAINWSYALLNKNEQMTMRGLSIFSGGFSLEAAEFVIASRAIETEISVLDLLTGLTDKSIVSIAENIGETRYSMLETLRQYGGEKSIENSEDETVRHAHFKYFLDFAERAETGFATTDKRVWLARLEKETDNLRLALEWIADKNAADFLRLANALWQFWQSSGRLAEGRRHLENALAADENAPAELRAKALHRMGGLLVLECDYSYAARIYERALEISRAAGEKFLTARILANYGFALVNLSEYEHAEKFLSEGLKIFRELKDDNGIAQISNGLGAVAYYQEDFSSATNFFAEALTIYRRTANQLNVIGVLQNLGSSAHLQNDLSAAETYLTEALKLAEDLGERRWINQTRHVLGYVCNDRKDYARAAKIFTDALKLDPEIGGKDNIAHTFEGLACTCAALGDNFRAVKLLIFADHLRGETKTPRGKALQNYFDRYLNAAAAQLTADEMDSIKIGSLNFSLEQMLAFALENQ